MHEYKEQKSLADVVLKKETTFECTEHSFFHPGIVDFDDEGTIMDPFEDDDPLSIRFLFNPYLHT